MILSAPFMHSKNPCPRLPRSYSCSPQDRLASEVCSSSIEISRPALPTFQPSNPELSVSIR